MTWEPDCRPNKHRQNAYGRWNRLNRFFYGAIQVRTDAPDIRMHEIAYYVYNVEWVPNKGRSIKRMDTADDARGAKSEVREKVRGFSDWSSDLMIWLYSFWYYIYSTIMVQW